LQKRGLLSSFLSVVLLLSFTSVASENPSFSQVQEKGPYVDQARFIHRADENLALEEVKSGSLDMYFFPIPYEGANDARNDPRLKVYDTTAGKLGFLVNPAPAADPNILNPFQL
jgi:ABC-type transport system substrate-binding protein